MYSILFVALIQGVYSLSSLLIFQNRGGGHGSIAYELCRTLSKTKPLDIHVVQDKCNYKTIPFSSYSELKDLGVTIHDYSLSDPTAAKELASTIANKKFDVVVDNWSKNADNAKYCIDVVKSSKPQQYIFISSAGMYKSGPEAPLTEDSSVKSNDARKIELEVLSSGLPYTFLRPQYIYGDKCNKRYLDYFIGRAYRKLPIPLPLHGEQLVCLTHLEDVAGLIAASLGQEKAINQIFNCGTDRYITYKGLAKAVHSALGNAEEDIKFTYYDPDQFPHWDGKGVQEFPFRKETFITSCSKAKQLLQWQPRHLLTGDLAAEVQGYKALGGDKEQWTGEETKYDTEILESKKVKAP